MYNSSPIKNILAIVGFIVVFSFLSQLLGGILFFVLKFLIPIALILWLVRYLSGNNHNRYNRYR